MLAWPYMLEFFASLGKLSCFAAAKMSTRCQSHVHSIETSVNNYKAEEGMCTEIRA